MELHAQRALVAAIVTAFLACGGGASGKPSTSFNGKWQLVLRPVAGGDCSAENGDPFNREITVAQSGTNVTVTIAPDSQSGSPSATLVGTVAADGAGLEAEEHESGTAPDGTSCGAHTAVSFTAVDLSTGTAMVSLEQGFTCQGIVHDDTSCGSGRRA